jgi:hypothetical protein
MNGIIQNSKRKTTYLLFSAMRIAVFSFPDKSGHHTGKMIYQHVIGDSKVLEVKKPLGVGHFKAIPLLTRKWSNVNPTDL